MSWKSKVISTSIFALSISVMQADDLLMPIEINLSEAAVSRDSIETQLPMNAENNTAAQKPRIIVKKQEAFRPFTGKVKGKKVRMRASPDMEGRIVKELQKGDLLSVVEDKGDYWGVEPSVATKAFVFRSFVIDDKVEGNRVNVRLEPNLESPVIAHLNAGDTVNGSISAVNNKWLEISAPKSTRFYVSKDYVENVGGPELKEQHDKREKAVTQMLEAASILSKAEMKKSFSQIDIDKITRNYKTVIEDYSDFPLAVEKAQNELATLQEDYLQQRLAYLEEKSIGTEEKEEATLATAPIQMSERMKMWESLEEALYLSWSNANSDKSIEEYYSEQKLAAFPVSGIVEVYQTAAKSRPGDFLIKDQNLPKACLYSTKVDLQKYVGKKVTLQCVQRPNNNFAFPAYFVVGVE